MINFYSTELDGLHRVFYSAKILDRESFQLSWGLLKRTSIARGLETLPVIRANHPGQPRCKGQKDAFSRRECSHCRAEEAFLSLLRVVVESLWICQFDAPVENDNEAWQDRLDRLDGGSVENLFPQVNNELYGSFCWAIQSLRIHYQDPIGDRLRSILFPNRAS